MNYPIASGLIPGYNSVMENQPAPDAPKIVAEGNFAGGETVEISAEEAKAMPAPAYVVSQAEEIMDLRRALAEQSDEIADLRRRVMAKIGPF